MTQDEKRIDKIGGPRSVQYIFPKGVIMGKPNFDFQKRQKEIAKKKKNEEKKLRKQEKNAAGTGDNPEQPAGESGESLQDRGAGGSGA